MSRRTRFVLPAFLAVALVAVIAAANRPAPVIAANEIGAYGFHAGELVNDFKFRDIDGNKGRLSSTLADHEALVVFVRTTECPVSKRYGHELARIEKEYGEQGIAFAYLDVSSQDSREKILEDIETFGFAAPYISDPNGDVGSNLQVKVSTEVFVIDQARTLRYRGAVDDQYGINFGKPEPRETYVRDALDAILAGEQVKVAETEASGCYLETPVTTVVERDVTYNTRVSRIVQENCVTCHRTGGVAPFPLDSYEQVSGFSAMIEFMVTEGRMPPWFASPEHGEWANDRSLSDRDKRDLLAWIAGGMPEGDPDLAPIPATFAEGWDLERDPDVIIQIPEPESVPAEGVLDYRHIYVKTDFEQDMWIQAVQAKPTAPQVTHHIIVYYEEPGAERRGPWLVGYAPGNQATVFPEGSGRKIEKGATLMFELHYTTNGTPTEDQAMMGLLLSDEPPEREVLTAAVATGEFEIPPHADNHEVVAEMTFRNPGTIYELLPHMHVRGKAFKYDLIRADGTEETLLEVPAYDFNWQLSYTFEDPLRIEPGDMLRGTAWYDNSENNPNNPDPTSAVTYGEQSFEEMMFGFFQYIPDPKSADGEDDQDG